MHTTCAQLPYLVVAAVALAGCCCDAFYCHVCGAVSESEGDSCNLDNVCEATAASDYLCYIVLREDGSWNASCTDPWAASGMKIKRDRKWDLVLNGLLYTAGNGTFYGACGEELCNDAKRQLKPRTDLTTQPILPKADNEVSCYLCGSSKIDGVFDYDGIDCTLSQMLTCSGEFCVTVQGGQPLRYYPRHFCGDSWLLVKIGRNLSDIVGCQTLPNGEERCVCDTNDCNKPARLMATTTTPGAPPGWPRRSLYEAVAGHIEDFYASASTEQKKFIETVVRNLHDHIVAVDNVYTE